MPEESRRPTLVGIACSDLEWLLTYHARVTLAHNIQRSQVPHDVTREAVERILPKLLGSYLGFNYFKHGQYSEEATALSKFYLQRMRYFMTQERGLRDTLVFGRGVKKWQWRLDQRDRRRVLSTAEIVAFQHLGMVKFPRKVTETQTFYDGPWCGNVDPFAMTYDTSVDDPQRCYFLFEEVRYTIQQMMEEVRQGRFDEEAVQQYETETPPTQPGFVDRWRNEAIARIGIDYGTAYSLSEPTAFALEEGYFPFDLDDDGRDEPLLLVCDPGFKTAFRCEENPWDHGQSPYSFSEWIRVTGEHWPIGIVEILEPDQTLLNVWSNLGLDNIVLSIFSLWIAHRDAHIPGNALMVIPNRIIKSDMPPAQAIQALKPEDHTQTILANQQFYLKRAQELTGITQFNALGTPEVGQTRTALGIQTLKAAAEEFLTFAKRRMREGTMATDAELMLALLQQYMDRPQAVEILGDDGVVDWRTVDPDELLGDFSWQAVVEDQSPLSRELDAQNIENAAQMAMKMQVPINMQKVWIDLAKARNVPHPETWLLPQQPGVPGMATNPAAGMQNMAARQAIAAGGQQGKPSLAGGPQPAAPANQLATQGGGT